jgi:hypothetical protein
MAVKVWQGEQQQRQDDLSKVDGTGRNKGCVFMLEVVVSPSASVARSRGPMARHAKPATSLPDCWLNDVLTCSIR